MARRRKSDTKATAKASATVTTTTTATTTTSAAAGAEKPAAVRKSRRQIAKKQLDKKVNGETTVQTSKSNDSEETDCNKVAVVQHKKFGKYRCTNENSKNQNNQDIKSNAESSDSQDIAAKLPANIEAENVVETVVEVDQTPNSDEVVWQEDVIEETIEICEEMEVEEDGVGGTYTITQEEGSVLLEEVLLVNNHDFEGEGVVEFTVIRNEDGTESMVVSRDEENLTCKDYVTESMTLPDMVKTVMNNKNNEQSEFQEIEKRVSNISVTENEHKSKEIPASSDFSKITEAGDARESTINSVNGDKKKAVDAAKEKIRLDDSQMISVSNVRVASCDKLDSGIPFLETQPCEASIDLNSLSKSMENSKIENFIKKEDNVTDKEKKSDHFVEPFSSPTYSIEKPKAVAEEDGDSKTAIKIMETEISAEIKVEGSKDIQNDESSGDSEVDTKADTEDIKLSSSSENSNDTLLSSNSCKLPEFNDVKNIPNQHNEAEKKTGFRSRSGSTDTTGSESGSNSSGVRRSSRIRSIGLMKQRSRGRGLVTKPNLDLSRAIFQQDREKLSSAFSQDSKDNSDNQSETQSDKETSGNKTAGFFDTPAPLAALSSTAGYESDTSKPVKVKSRWRRSSELEMGGSNKVQTQSGESDASGENVSHLLGSPCTDLALSSNNKINSGKNLLPPVLEIKDKEMEERLRQFEHLTENLYLTERYTNKETKRMVCDCFLTDEEIARGELGCGEDCLNRLLMIECGSRCVVGNRCTNKRFQNCEYAKCEVFRTDKKGFGLRANVDLQSGEFLMEYVGEVVDPKDFRRRAKDYSKDKNRHYYFMALKSDQIIDATAKGNISRFINHSCDPNSETQKWTVNGELRIGFFNKQFIAAGEEITFDYHFQRYGKEAQRCYCEAENCRGWIGETPEEENDKIEKKEKTEKDVKKKKEEKKIHDYTEDEDLEEEMEKLCSGGLKNRAHTLTLSRLMVRSRELEHRTRLLRLIQSGEQPCRRLFLDYHGLRLIWSYMMDVATNNSTEAQDFRLEILKTLNTLPIPNKTMLMDSKVYGVVEKWAKQLYSSPTRGSPEDDDQTKPKINNEEPDSSCDVDSNDKAVNLEANSKSLKDSQPKVAANDVETEVEDETKIVEEQNNAFTELANSLLCDWSNLKEVFRIPKKERIEQMKEHEREADRGYREDLEKEDRRDKSYERSYRSDRYSRGESDKRIDRRRGRDSPEFDHNRSKDKQRAEERVNLVPIPRMSKYERRQLFALKVAKEEEERQRRQQQETWQEHEARCLALGMDPHTTAALDPQTGYPLFFNPSLGQWQHYPPIQEAADLTPQCPVYIGASQTLPGHPQPGIMPPNPHMIPSGVPPPSVFAQNQNSYPLALPHHHDVQQFNDATGQIQISSNLIPIQNGAPQEMPSNNIYGEKIIGEQPFNVGDHSESLTIADQIPPPLDLPPKWKSARDARGRTYYYNISDRIPQWLPPPPDHLGNFQDTSSSSESSEESSSSEEEEDDIEDEDGEEEPLTEDSVCVMEVDGDAAESSALPKVNMTENLDGVEENLIVVPEPKKRRDGLVQERIISPRREDDRVDHKKYKETKEKLKRQKEKAKLKEHADKSKKHRRNSKSKIHARHNLNKLQALPAERSPNSERKIKDTFRMDMAHVMVHILNPYRKNDCKQGRITNTEDFKHLARKLTHFVLAKELKHCKSVDELECNDNVKHKAKDFVRKYMSKFGAVYQKASDDE